MIVDGANILLMVDPLSLTTSLEYPRYWTCADTDDNAQKDTRFLRAIEASHAATVSPAHADGMLRGAGLSHGAGLGSFVTGDLCPSHLPLDRDFLELMETTGFRAPVALSVSGLWLTHHIQDFRWLQEQDRTGALAITWINHSYHHPFDPWLPTNRDFLLRPGLDIQAEILETERLLIAQGATPSVFFRFPGLISDATLMDIVRQNHLIALGADGWLLFSPPLRPGAVLLTHPNGNERVGLRMFAHLLQTSKLPRPFRPIEEAP